MSLPENCRLCGGTLSPRFQLLVLHKHRVSYFECQTCHSLQTETPYWLEEAYQKSNLSYLDTGAAQRNLNNQALCLALARLFGAKNVVDRGGGDGLLCRLLRDHGLNCFVSDKYAQPTYAQGFTSPTFTQPDMLIAFEVLEHFAQPKEDVKDLFSTNAKIVFASTLPYTNNGQDWWYLSLDSGQHVFFYSPQALQMIAKNHGYEVMIRDGYALFVQSRHITWIKKKLAFAILSPRWRCYLRAFVAWRANFYFSAADMQKLQGKNKENQE